MNLDELRRQIDQLDERLAQLLAERAGLATEIGENKQDQQTAIYDAAREAQVLRRLDGLDTAPLPSEALRRIYREVLSACRDLQQPLKVAYLGPEHTFTHLAARQQFGSSCELLMVTSITEVFRAVQQERAHFGVVPIENSTGGVVPETLDCFIDSDLAITNELYVPVHLFLMAQCPLEAVTTLYSHPQPLAQSRNWLRQHLPQVRVEKATSTVAAAQAATQDPTGAAIATELAAGAYDLEILATNIEDEPANRTRFFVISPHDAAPTGQDKTSIVFTTTHQAGALHAALQPLATYQINMTFIQSHPSRGRLWEYVFFVDFEGHRSEAQVRQALDELTQQCPLLKVLGSYPAAD